MKNITKKILAVLSIFLIAGLLNSCGNEAPEEALKAFDGGIFTINIDPGWKVTSQSELGPEAPQGALAAFTSPMSYGGFNAHIGIVEESLKSSVSSIDFGRSNIDLAAQTLTDYKKIQEAEVDLNGTAALIHIFTARLSPTEKELRYTQLYTTKNQNGYTVTAGMALDTPEADRDAIGAAVTSFRLK